MNKYLVITIRFLGDRYHGRTKNGGEHEWPPSPLRLFQAIVAGASTRWHDAQIHAREIAALEWFEELEPPHIIAPIAHVGKPLLKYVPENVSDIDPEKRDAKFSRPTLFVGQPIVVYYWPITPDHENHAKTIANCSRHCHTLGWGIDMVIGNGNLMENEPCDANGEKWLPRTQTSNGITLRTPCHGTMKQLQARFSHSLKRIDPKEGRNPVPPLSAYRNVSYQRETEPTPRPIAVFALLKPDASGFRAFNTVQKAFIVAGMMKCAVKLAAEHAGWSSSDIDKFILGHGEPEGSSGHVPVGPQRFAYLPLPSIEERGEGKARVVGSVRRILLTTFADGSQDKIVWARRVLSGQELIDEKTKEPVACLSLIPTNETIVQYYLRPASSWTTVTPVVLPGYDDPAHLWRRLEHVTTSEEQRRLLGRLANRIDGLIRKAILQAGYSKELAENAEIEWRKTGFLPGTDLTMRYGIPDHLQRYSRYHVMLRWRDANKRLVKVPGPVCIGGGRFFGLGLFVPTPDNKKPQ